MKSVMFSHIIPALLVYLVCLIVFFAIIYLSLRTAKNTMTDEMYKKTREGMFKLVKIVVSFFTITAVIITIMIVTFLSNPFEDQNAGRIPQAQQRHVIIPDVKGHDEKKAVDMNKQAEQDNTKAMENIFKIADDAQKGESK